MAAKKKKAAKKTKAKKKIPMKGDGPPKKGKSAAGGGMGHNLTRIRDLAVPFMARRIRIEDEKQETLDQFREDIDGLITEAAREIGCSEKIVRREFGKAIRKRAEEKRDLVALSDKEREDIDTLRAAFDGTPFGKWFEGETPKPPRTEPATTEEHAENEEAQAAPANVVSEEDEEDLEEVD